MDKIARNFEYGWMTRGQLKLEALELAEVAEAMRVHINAIPRDVVASMPFLDREWIDGVLDKTDRGN